MDRFSHPLVPGSQSNRSLVSLPFDLNLGDDSNTGIGAMSATPGWPIKRKYFPFLLLHTEGLQVKASLVPAAYFNAWVWLQETPSTNQSEPAALSFPYCQVKQNSGNMNRIITISQLLEPDTREPTPWHCHPLVRSRHEEVLRGLKKVWPMAIPAQQETLWLVFTHYHPHGSLQGLFAKARREEGLPSLQALDHREMPFTPTRLD